MLIPHHYFWKSAKWLRGLRLQTASSAAALAISACAGLRAAARELAARSLQHEFRSLSHEFSLTRAREYQNRPSARW